MTEAQPDDLIITNSDVIGRQLISYLQDLGHNPVLAIGARSGQRRLDLAKEGETDFGLVILDGDMPYPDVRALAEKVRSDHSSAKIAIPVGWWNERSSEIAVLGDAYFYKPTHPEQLLQVFDDLNLPH